MIGGTLTQYLDLYVSRHFSIEWRQTPLPAVNSHLQNSTFHSKVQLIRYWITVYVYLNINTTPKICHLIGRCKLLCLQCHGIYLHLPLGAWCELQLEYPWLTQLKIFLGYRPLSESQRSLQVPTMLLTCNKQSQSYLTSKTAENDNDSLLIEAIPQSNSRSPN